MSLERYVDKLSIMCDFGDALRSLGTDPRVKVGAVVFPVDCSAVWGIGYNGAAAGLDHDRVASGSSQLGSGASGAAHAEANALLKSGDKARQSPSIIYSTLMPCPYCAPLIANSFGVCGVVVGEARKDTMSGLHVLEEAGIPVLARNQLRDARDERSEAVIQWWRSMRASRLAPPRMLRSRTEGAER